MSLSHENINDLYSLGDEIMMYDDTINAVSRYGISKSSFLILKSSGLLSSTSFDAIALEGFNDNCEDIALESLIDKVKEKVAKWSAKALSFAKTTASKISNTLGNLLEKLKNISKNVIDKVFDKADAGKQYVKAHPYKTIALTIAAVLTVLGIGQFIIKGFPVFRNAAKIPQFMKTVGGMIAKVNYPLGKITTAFSKGGMVMKVSIGTGTFLTGVGTIAALGWTKDKVASVYREYSQIKVNSETITKGSMNLISNTARDGVSFVKGVYTGTRKGFDAGYYSDEDSSETKRVVAGATSMTITTFAVLLAAAAYVVYKLITGVVIGALKVICISLNALLGAKESKDDDEFL